MARRRKDSSGGDTATVRAAIERWRGKRKKRTRMPEELWEAAVELARRDGVYRVSQDLGLGYEGLKTRLVRSQGSRTPAAAGARTPSAGAKEPAPKFVELVPTVPTGLASVVVEVQDAAGAKLTMRFEGGTSVDVGAVVRAFRVEGRRGRRR